jgi:uncharacterized membrane protein YczE
MFKYFKPHKTVPSVPWTARHHWDLNLPRFAILFVGLALYGLGEAFLFQAQLGNSPWVVLSQGISLHSRLTIGWATFVVSTLVMLLWIPLKEKPGLGTISNIIVIAFFIQIGIDYLPTSHNPIVGIAMTLFGIGMVGVASALYITTGLGRGPRDGLMTALHRITGVRVGRVRLFVEVIVLSIGFLLGGRLGIGTFLFALLIGQSIAIWFGFTDKVLNGTARKNRA